MFVQEFNTRYERFNEAVNFAATTSAIQLNRVFFITTASSASASELLINSLSPYLSTVLVGQNSFGKPVGSLVLPVMDYVILPIAFRTVNADGLADYYEGLPVSYARADGLDKDFGDPTETCLATALEIIGGAFPPQQLGANLPKRGRGDLREVNQKLDDSFKEMFIER
ncbi:MAG: hypothetical protein HC880_19535 [Bacteroidia bacterium]|nr:hypothetical protein [Bacteroidia bacterium]